MTSPVRVLWLIKGLGPGGAERLLVSAARLADHDAFRYDAAYVVAAKDRLVPELRALGVRVHHLGGGRLGWPADLRRLLREERYDVVHLHSPLVAGVARLVARTLPRGRRPVLVSTEHNMWNSYGWRTRMLNAMLHRTDRVRWAVSERVKESIWVARRQVRVLVHGIVLDDLAPLGDDEVRALRADLGVDPDDVVALTVANYRTEKAYPDLLRAFATAMTASPRLRLVIVGQGQLEDEVRRLHHELGLGERCRIVGYRSDVSRVVQAADLFVLASRFEGLPIALLEALAAGLPVAATAVGGIPDVVEHGREGLLSEPGRPDDLAQSLVTLSTDDELRARMAVAARVRGASFDAADAVRTMEEAYASIARTRPEVSDPHG